MIEHNDIAGARTCVFCVELNRYNVQVAQVIEPVFDGRPGNVLVHLPALPFSNLFPDELDRVIEQLRQALELAKKMEAEFDARYERAKR